LEFVDSKREDYSMLDPPIQSRTHAATGRALFFSEFLLIHPFPNAIGRIARLLLNFLFKKITVVPFSIHYGDRQVYIQVLEEGNAGDPPDAFATYMLLCAARASGASVYLSAD
jgi:fido (protein-threonine AMPylation protein)